MRTASLRRLPHKPRVAWPPCTPCDPHGPVGPRRQRDGGAAREIARASRRSASTNRALLRDAATIPRQDHRGGRVRFPPPPPFLFNDIDLLRAVRAAHPRPN